MVRSLCHKLLDQIRCVGLLRHQLGYQLGQLCLQIGQRQRLTRHFRSCTGRIRNAQRLNIGLPVWDGAIESRQFGAQHRCFVTCFFQCASVPRSLGKRPAHDTYNHNTASSHAKEAVDVIV